MSGEHDDDELADAGRSRESTLNPEAYKKALLDAFSLAEERIWIKVPWVHPPEGEPAPLLQALRECLQRGVDVRVVLRPEASNMPTLSILSAWDLPHRVVRYLHEKECLVDDRLITFSANFTNTDLTRNSNTLYEIWSAIDIEAAAVAFENHWNSSVSEAAAGEEQWTQATEVISSDLLEFLGTRDLNPVQAKALPVVFGSDVGLVVTSPTGSGKTLIGQAAVIKAIKCDGRKAAFICPSRALVEELRDTLDKWSRSGIRVEYLSGDLDVDMDSVKRADLWVGTTESFESAFRKASLSDEVADLGCVVIDEIHLLGDETRGPLLEALIARLRLLSAQTRLVGLSATVRNNQELAEWLGAELVHSVWRPTQLTLQVVPYANRDNWTDDEEAKDDATESIIDDITGAGHEDADSGGVIVFCGSKPKVRRVASHLARLSTGLDEGELAERALKHGVGIHYNGLPPDHLRRTMNLFDKGEIKTVVATTTLASSVNTPARAVIIRDTVLGRDTSLSAGDVLQMAGRAGRFGRENEGFAYLLAPRTDVSSWREKVFEGHFVNSQLAGDLADHLLAEVLLKRIRSADTLRDWFAGTFATHQGGLSRQESEQALNEALELLLTSRMITEDADSGLLDCSPIGKLTSRFLIRCECAAAILGALPGSDPITASAAEAQILTVIAKKAKAFNNQYAADKSIKDATNSIQAEYVEQLGKDTEAGTIKTLLAADLALRDPAALRGSRPVCGISTSDLRSLSDDLSRHLVWLGALGAASPLTWVPAVSTDLGYRIKWRNAAPTRGSGRHLRFLEQRIRPTLQKSNLPKEFNRDRYAPDALARLANSSRNRRLPLVELLTEVEQTANGLEIAVLASDPEAFRLHLTTTARSNAIPSLALSTDWAGEKVVLPFPEGAIETLEVWVEAIAYGRYDWGYGSSHLEIDPGIIEGNPETELQRCIAALPHEAMVLKRRRRLFVGKRRRSRQQVEAALGSTSDALSQLSYLMAGYGSDHERAWRIAQTLRTQVSIDPRSSKFTTPAAAIIEGRASQSAWAIAYATTARHAGFETGIAQEDDGRGELFALVKRVGEWRLVSATPISQALSLIPVTPRESLGSVQVLTRPPDRPTPLPVTPLWRFLDEFRKSTPPDDPPSTPPSTGPKPSNSAETPPKGLQQHTPEQRAMHEAKYPGLLAKHPRAFVAWAPNEDEYLAQRHNDGVAVQEIARLLGRTVGAINSRIEALGLEGR